MPASTLCARDFWQGFRKKVERLATRLRVPYHRLVNANKRLPHVRRSHRRQVDRRVLRGVRALRGQEGRHGRDPVRNAVAPAQCASGRTRPAAAGRAAVSRGGADAAQSPSGAGTLDRRERSHRQAGARGRSARPGRLRGRLHHRGPDARTGDAGDPQGRGSHPGDLQRASRSARAHGARRRPGKERARGCQDAAWRRSA